MKTLIVEDDFTSRLLLQRYLAPYGECHIAVNGLEAIAAFDLASDRQERYDLICLDISMPEMDGQAVLKAIRKKEEEDGVVGGVKIVMTTALGDKDNVMAAFREQCDAYLVKPVEKPKLLDQLKEIGLAVCA